ncbi:MerR family transcriptional regulator [Paucilactobacillus suebicus]|uniref:Regulatory protein MerR n=1 Tax=Paucilactobacillus suebicus DSM 5007 = KCTC 3549 TaxID=1423807 RepID=A0A0R1W1E1_9LACO|nr:MerR family transcriptional regulator [Paucilactobacillus suebicus]KRM11421.1 regulatory protein MerR [Paucilactobacillus suebicus DSM 5007 = KCTC 3549]
MNEKIDNFTDWVGLTKQIFKSDGITVGTADIVKATGVPVSQLRYWVEQGYVRTVPEPNQRSRKFSYRAVFRVRAIKYFLDSGYTLAYATKQVSYFNRIDRQLEQVIFDKMTDANVNADGDMEISLGEINDGADILMLVVTDRGAKFWTIPK